MLIIILSIVIMILIIMICHNYTLINEIDRIKAKLDNIGVDIQLLRDKLNEEVLKEYEK